ncbi:histidine kinase-like ATPase domain protein [Mycobacterium avium MAV_120709_2344]|nr:ATP-binding protein [Mycobacterium avium]ETZ52280.1 histidine kinase-like ATPase domain protein [Mycobacterium avium MAV_120709_2344]
MHGQWSGEPLTAFGRRSRYDRTLTADAASATHTRIDFAAWLQRHFWLREQQLSDMVLAVNEALANAVEFAYLDTAGAGTVALAATYTDDTDTLAVTITDGGAGRPDPRRRGQVTAAVDSSSCGRWPMTHRSTPPPQGPGSC